MQSGLSDFKKLMSARFLFTFAVQMQAVVVGWQVYELTRNPLALGLVGLTEAVPALGLALYAGYLVDRMRPLKAYSGVLLCSFVSAAVLLGSQFSGQLLGSRIGFSGQVAALYIASFITGLGRSFSQPAVFSTVPRIVPREDLPRASAWMSTMMQIARLTGPGVGGLIFGLFGMAVSAGSICAILLAALACVSLIHAKPDAPPASSRRKSMKDELLSGVSFVFGHRILLPALSLDMISVLFGGVTAVLPIYAAEILFIGPKGLGFLRAAPALGAAITSLWLTRRKLRGIVGPWLFSAVTGFGLSILIFSVSRDFTVSLLALSLAGAFDSVSMVIRNSAVQLASPDDMRGRISAVNSIFIGSSNEIGEFNRAWPHACWEPSLR